MENQIIQINLVPNMSTPAVVSVSQYDVGRPLVFKVYDGTSPADLTGVTAVIEGTKRSGLGFSESGTVSDNTVTLNTTLAMTQEDGSIPAEIRFSKTGEDVGTANFILAVEKSPHLEGTTDGTTETMADLETRLQAEIDDLSDRIDDIEAGGSGLSQTEKNLILTLFSKAAYAEDDADIAYEQLENLWATTDKTVTYNLSHVTSSNHATTVAQGASYTTTLTLDTDYTLETIILKMGGVDITATAYSSGTISIPSVTGNIVITASAVLAAESITAVYTQSGAVYTTDTLNSLKSDLVVTANYSGGSSAVVPSTDYTLSGTLTTGTSTITVEYGGLTTTFTVTVSAQPGMDWSSGVPYDMTEGLTENMYLNNGVEQSYNGWSISPYMQCKGAFIESDTTFTQYTGEYDATDAYIRKDNIIKDKLFNFDEYGITSFRVSETTSKVTNAVITPYDFPKLQESMVWQADQYYTPSDYTAGGYINSSNGTIVSNNAYEYSNYMNCYNASIINDYLSDTWRSYAFYDGNKEFISGVDVANSDNTYGKQITVPNGARYFRVSKTTPSFGLCYKLN